MEILAMAGACAPVIAVASFACGIWLGEDRGYRRGRNDGFNCGVSAMEEVNAIRKPKRGPDGKFAPRVAS